MAKFEKQLFEPGLARQGNRLKDLGCLADEGFEVAWVPSGELAAVFEACGWRGLLPEVHGHVSDDGHVLGAVAGAQAREVVVEDHGHDPVQAGFHTPKGAEPNGERKKNPKRRRKKKIGGG